MSNVLTTWLEKRSARRTRRELDRLSDHMLADIGLTRGDIAKVALHSRSSRH